MSMPERRERLLDHLVRELSSDSRLEGALLIGSGAEGFIDELSDVDLLLVVGDEADLPAVQDDWATFIQQTCSVLHQPHTPFMKLGNLQVFILDGLLELDTGFAVLDVLEPRWDRGKVLFDRDGRVADRLQSVQAPVLDVKQQVWLVDQACHRAMECRKAIYRGRVWQASVLLDELRASTLGIAGLVHLGSARQRDIDQLPAEVLAAVSSTIVPLNLDRQHDALRVLVRTMLAEAEQLYDLAAMEFPREFARALQTAIDDESSNPANPSP